MNIDVLLSALPSELVHFLADEFKKLHERYYLGHWDASQLNGGRFGEIVLRILEYKNSGIYTPIGSQIDRERVIRGVASNTALFTEMRLTIPRITAVLMDFRNTRNIAHVGLIAINAMDASYVIHSANWIMAELVRSEARISPVEAEQEVLKIIERKVPLVEEVGDRLRILDPKMSIKNRVLVFVYQKYPTEVTESDLWRWTEDKNRSRFHGYLLKLHTDCLVDFNEGAVQLTKRGLAFVEKNIDFQLVI